MKVVLRQSIVQNDQRREKNLILPIRMYSMKKTDSTCLVESTTGIFRLRFSQITVVRVGRLAISMSKGSSNRTKKPDQIREYYMFETRMDLQGFASEIVSGNIAISFLD